MGRCSWYAARHVGLSYETLAIREVLLYSIASTHVIQKGNRMTASIFKIPINVKIPLPKKAIAAGLLEPILRPIWRGPKTAGTALHDRVALHKSLLLCRNCESKMGRRHLARLQYAELRDYHGYRLCDGCQEESPSALWMWEGSHHIQHQNERAKWQAVIRREREATERWRR